MENRNITAAEFRELAERHQLPLSKEQRDNKYSRYLIVPAGTELPVEEGRSYFGSGDYSGGFRAAGNVQVEVHEWDNGCACGTRGKVTLQPGGVVSCRAGDGIGPIGGGRSFRNYIAACLPTSA